MTTNDFTSKLKGRFPKLNDDPFTIKDMEDGLNHFSSMNREKLFEAFINNFVYSRTPRWADLYKIAMIDGIRGSKENPLKDSFNICQVCNTAFSSVGRECPTCHKITSINISGDKKPDNFMPMHEDCGNCKHYKGAGTDGILCSDFGTSKSHTMPMCKDNNCICHRCCYETLAIREGAAGDTTKFDKLTSQNKWEADKMINN